MRGSETPRIQSRARTSSSARSRCSLRSKNTRLTTGTLPSVPESLPGRASLAGVGPHSGEYIAIRPACARDRGAQERLESPEVHAQRLGKSRVRSAATAATAGLPARCGAPRARWRRSTERQGRTGEERRTGRPCTPPAQSQRYTTLRFRTPTKSQRQMSSRVNIQHFSESQTENTSQNGSRISLSISLETSLSSVDHRERSSKLYFHNTPILQQVCLHPGDPRGPCCHHKKKKGGRGEREHAVSANQSVQIERRPSVQIESTPSGT